MDAMFPDAVFTLWRATVVLGLLVFLPLAVYSLHTLYRAVRSVRRYSRDGLTAAQAIAANTSAIPATNTTIGVAAEMLAAAEAVAAKLDAIAAALERRAGGR